jgi:uncharacterized protein (DUF1778 family)
MPRPRKKPEDRKDYHLRIPLTDAQRALIEEAAKVAESDMAAWARTILLEAAKRTVAKRDTKQTGSSGDGTG